MKRGIGFALCLIGFAALVFSMILESVDVVGTDAELYYALQTKAGVLNRAGISEGDLLRVDGALAEYLKGDAAALDFEIEVFGQMQPVFNEKEMLHMEDCRQLFLLLRRVLVTMDILAVSGIVIGVWCLRDRKKVRLASRIAPLAVILPPGALAAWAVMDFNAAFTFFHEVLFTNDLWLLNPSTDLLIRLCPTSMFMSMGVRIGVYSLVWTVLILAVTTIFTRAKKERG